MTENQKQQVIEGLKKSFKLFSKQTKFIDLDINGNLGQNGVPSKTIIGKIIRRDYFDKAPGRLLKWKRGAIVPLDLFSFYATSVKEYNADQTKIKRTRKTGLESPQIVNAVELADIEQPLKEALKKIKQATENEYVEINLPRILGDANIGNIITLSTLIRRDFLDKKGRSLLKWKENVQIPVNTEEYRVRAIKEYKGNPKAKNKSVIIQPSALEEKKESVMINVSNFFSKKFDKNLKNTLIATFQETKNQLIEEVIHTSIEHGITISVDELNKI
jgi:hypothetical protein